MSNRDAVHKAEKALFVLYWNCFMMMIQRGQFVTVMRMGASLFLVPFFLKIQARNGGYCFTWNM